MSRFKLIAFIALITLAFGVALVGDALAGEKVKFRVANYGVKFENVAVGDEEGHIVATYESKGIITNMQGKKFLDGWLFREAGLMDINGKAGTWSAQGYGEFADPDGDKIYVAWEGKKAKQDQPGAGTVRLIKGTGKWQGIQGKGSWLSYSPAADRVYSDVEWDVEWPR
jgi:hypothetical protein